VVLAMASGVTGCCWFSGSSPGVPAVPTETGARRGPEPAPAFQTVVLDVALLERPLGDGFLNHELWDLGNEQCVELEVKPVLEETGLRVAQSGGWPPPRLHALLKSPRSCPDPRRLHGDPDQPTPVQVGATRKRVVFQTHDAGQPRPVDLADAVCYF